MSFLKAEWRKLALFNYTISSTILEPFIPAGTELDIHNDCCYLSLVGFMFKNTQLLGMKIPYHTNFEEVNLRFYVRRFEKGTWKRGVVFIKEIVPKPALSFIANRVYKEHYETLPMRHVWSEDPEERIISYGWKKNNRWHQFQVQAELNAQKIKSGSDLEFITEHYWGYTQIETSKTNEYEVKHPTWKHYPVKTFSVDVDFGITYGHPFKFLNELVPTSVMLVEGSEVCVEHARKLQIT